MEEKNIQKRIITSVVSALVLLLMFTGIARAATEFRYQHDPMQNPDAAKDIIVNPNAVYGYSPSPDGSLKEFASADWTDAAIVEQGRQDRIQYLASFQELYDILYEMQDEGYEIEAIARKISTRRNELRWESYKDDPEGLETLKKRNLEEYGNEMGPTPEFLFEKYGSWETVITKAFSSNPGMDACLGLYDEMYDTYLISEESAIPKTGDSNEPAAVLVMLALSVSSILGASLIIKRKIIKE